MLLYEGRCVVAALHTAHHLQSQRIWHSTSRTCGFSVHPGRCPISKLQALSDLALKQRYCSLDCVRHNCFLEHHKSHNLCTTLTELSSSSLCVDVVTLFTCINHLWLLCQSLWYSAYAKMCLDCFLLESIPSID